SSRRRHTRSKRDWSSDVCSSDLFLALWSALAFLLAENWIANVLGVAVVAIVVFGIWSLIRELRFGANTEKLARILETEGKLPEDTLPRVRGRIDREAADREFEIYRA